MFANLSNPMAYIISFQMAVLLAPAFTALFIVLKKEHLATGASSGARTQESITEPGSLEIPRAA